MGSFLPYEFTLVVCSDIADRRTPRIMLDGSGKMQRKRKILRCNLIGYVIQSNDMTFRGRFDCGVSNPDVCVHQREKPCRK